MLQRRRAGDADDLTPGDNCPHDNREEEESDRWKEGSVCVCERERDGRISVPAVQFYIV